MTQKFKEIVRLILGGVILMIVGLSTIQAMAADEAKPPLEDCSSAKTTLTTASLLTPTQFVPVIPVECSQTAGGAAKALSLAAIPVIIVRIYGLLASTVFFLTGFNLIFASVRYSYGAFQDGEGTKALNSLQESGTSIILVLSSHLIISTLFSAIFKIPLKTDVSTIQSFFQ